MNEKKLKEDQNFVIEARGHYSTKMQLAVALEEYFLKKYKIADLHISFNSEMGDWTVSTTKHKLRAHYVESLPSLIQTVL